jgi:hypothetical protein
MHVPCRPPAISFVTQLTNRSPLSFEIQTKKPSRWLWGPNHQTIAAYFEAQTGKPANLTFEAQPRSPRSSPPCAWCRPHTALPDLSIVRPKSTRPMLDHSQSSAPGLLLLPRSSSLPTMSHLSPTHHETRKHNSPYGQIGVKQLKYPRFKFKLRQVNYSS